MDHFWTVFNTRWCLVMNWTNNAGWAFATLTSACCVLSLMPSPCYALGDHWRTRQEDMTHLACRGVDHRHVMYELRLFLMSRWGSGLRLVAPGALPNRLRGAGETLVYSMCKSVISSPPSRESAVVLQDLGSDHYEEDVGKRFRVAVRIGRSWGWRRRRKLKEKEWKTQDGNKEPWE